MRKTRSDGRGNKTKRREKFQYVCDTQDCLEPLVAEIWVLYQRLPNDRISSVADSLAEEFLPPLAMWAR